MENLGWPEPNLGMAVPAEWEEEGRRPEKLAARVLVRRGSDKRLSANAWQMGSGWGLVVGGGDWE